MEKEKETAKESEKDNAIMIDVLTKAITIPGVKVEREKFLVDIFDKADADKRDRILRYGPVKAGCSRHELKHLARYLVNKRSLESSGISFMTGLPGGLAMIGTIPADTLQFYGVTLRLAQEIAYLYGADDMFKGGAVDQEKVSNQMLLYCGVMFGVSGAGATLKVMSKAMSGQVAKKLPQKALTKTIYYPMIKRIAALFGVKLNKTIFAKSVSKMIPVLGGVVSGGLTLASMRPMGLRLINEFDKGIFDYTDDDYNKDVEEVMNIIDADAELINTISDDEIKDISEEPDMEETDENEETENVWIPAKRIREAKKMLDDEVITEEEFKMMKSKIIEDI